MCIDNVEIWFGTANEQILSIFDKLSALMSVFPFLDNNLSKLKYCWIFTKQYVHCYCGGLVWDC